MEAKVLFTRQKRKKNSDSCVVEGCKSRANNDASLSFHSFPKKGKISVEIVNYFGNVEKIDKLKAWTKALNINNLKNSKPYMKVCSKHFARSDFHTPDYQDNGQFLKKFAVPTCNLPLKSNTSKHVTIFAARLDRRTKRDAVKKNYFRKSEFTASEARNNNQSNFQGLESTLSADVECAKINEYTDQIYEKPMPCIDESCAVNCDKDIQDVPAIQSEVLSSVLNKSIQTDEPMDCIDLNDENNSQQNKLFCLSMKIRTDSELRTFTGIESFEILNFILEVVRLKFNNRFDSLRNSISLKNKVILVYMKLKHNLPYASLAILFGISAEYCSDLFHMMIRILSESLKQAIVWPSKEDNAKNIPLCFQGFENVRVVLDLTEIHVQRSNELCCRTLTFSNYKKDFTTKVMTGVSPGGRIIYVSKFYGGRASDTTIFLESDIIKKLDPGDAILVDKGFLINEVCELNRWKLIRPPFLTKDRPQLTKEESHLTQKIATARVHIERSNQRIKAFKLLGSKMPVNLVPIIDDIFTVICATINLSSPILKDNKFMKN